MRDKLLFNLGAKIQRFKILNAHIINRRLIRETKQMPKAWKVGKGNDQNQYVNTTVPSKPAGSGFEHVHW